MKKVEKTFEEKIVSILNDKLLETITKSVGWNISSELSRGNFYSDAIKKIVAKNREKIENTVNNGIEKAFANTDFVSEMEKTINKKLTESIISKFDSEVQSIIDKMRAKNPVFNEEIKVAINKIINKYNKQVV